MIARWISNNILLLDNMWWSVVLFLCCVLEYRLGRKIGRRIGYKEGWSHGIIDGPSRELVEAAVAVSECKETDGGPCGGCLEELDDAVKELSK